MKKRLVALIGFLAVATFLLWEEHQAHILGILPWALVLINSAVFLLFAFSFAKPSTKRGSITTGRGGTP